MTLAEYQRIAGFWDSENDEVTQIALIVCDLYNLSYDEVNNMEPRKFLKLSKKVEKSFIGIDKKPLYSRIKLNVDAFSITLGQFIEVQHFLKLGEIDSMHLVAASIWEDKREHKLKAEILLNKNIRYVLKDISAFLLSFANLLNSYKGLFEAEEQNLEGEEDAKVEKPHPFIEQYGWIYSAKQVAEHEGITLDKAFELPVLQAFNTLAYLKSYQSYQKYISK
jgi:hypothetical protein